MRREVMAAMREIRTEGFRLNGSTGTPSLAEGQFRGTVTDNGVGDYTITFAAPYARTPIATVATLTADSIIQISAISSTAVRVLGFDATDGTTAKEIDAMILVYGSDTPDQQ